MYSNDSEPVPKIVISPNLLEIPPETPRVSPEPTLGPKSTETQLDEDCKDSDPPERKEFSPLPTWCWDDLSRKDKVKRKLRQLSRRLWSFWQPLIKRGIVEALPGLILIVLSLIFASIFLAVDPRGPCGCDKPQNSCDVFWTSLYYTNTLHTSIGYGSVTPCTTSGRAITIVYIVVAIPLMLLTLSRFGGWLLSLVHQMGVGWRLIRHQKDNKSKSDFNLVCGVILALSWILISAAIIYACGSYQDGVVTFKDLPRTYFNSFYFTMISLMTVGLGDIDFKDRQFTILYFTIIFIGYSMVSMVIQLFQEKMEEFMKDLIHKVEREYQESMLIAELEKAKLEEGEAIEEGPTERQKRDAKDTINGLFNSSLQNKFVSLFLNDKQLVTLLEKVEASGNMVTVGTQTGPVPKKPKPKSPAGRWRF